MFKITFISTLFLHIVHAHFVYQSPPHSSSQSYGFTDTASIVFSSDSVRVTGIIPQERSSFESLVNSMDDGFHIASNAENDSCATPKHCKCIRKMRRSTQTLCIQKKPTHSITETRKWTTPSHASKPNTTTHDNIHSMSTWCNNAHKQHGETGSIATNHTPRNPTVHNGFIQRSDACSALKRVDIVFILLIIGLTLFGYTWWCDRVSRDVIDPPRINRKQSDSIHLSRQHTRYTHHASTAQSIQTRIKALYEPIIQYQGSTYIQSLGSVVAALFGGFVSKSHTFKLFLFLSF
eukprot:778823_1